MSLKSKIVFTSSTKDLGGGGTVNSQEIDRILTEEESMPDGGGIHQPIRRPSQAFQQEFDFEKSKWERHETSLKKVNEITDRLHRQQIKKNWLPESEHIKLIREQKHKQEMKECKFQPVL